jgi:hypothetical protein
MMVTGIWGQEITPLNASSIYFSHLDKIKIQAGIWTLNALTNISISHDITKINQALENFDNAILKLQKENKHSFEQELATTTSKRANRLHS